MTQMLCRKCNLRLFFGKQVGGAVLLFKLSSYQAISSVKLAKIGQEVCEKLWPSPALAGPAVLEKKF